MLVVLLLFISLTATGNCQCSQQLVNNINRLGTTWRAQTSFPTGQMPDVCGTMDPGKIPMQKVQLMSTIPSEFDARVKWSHCQTMNLIRNQGRCGSCWAFGTSGMMSDRICTCDLGNNVQLSPQNLITCCAPKKMIPNGCDGVPTLDVPFECWIDNGIVTEGCQPYTLVNGGVPPKCSNTCTSGYSKSYSDDLYKGKKYYRIESDVATIQSEIMRNGPIAVGFDVYEDFRCYGSGVYQHVTGNLLGQHLVRLIGWGEENGVPYWLLANSWGTRWGTLGFFKVLRGANEVNIESMPIAGTSNGDAPSGAPSLIMLMLWIIAYLLP